MIVDFVDLCTYAYVLVDELYQAVAAPHDARRSITGGRTIAPLAGLPLTSGRNWPAERNGVS
ncbi:MAG: hypothetical protein M3Q65_24505 [Chloroflexota bacterium]|nr:hypothetical protein [Chloroflexota bacterium]